MNNLRFILSWKGTRLSVAGAGNPHSHIQRTWKVTDVTFKVVLINYLWKRGSGVCRGLSLSFKTQGKQRCSWRRRVMEQEQTNLRVRLKSLYSKIFNTEMIGFKPWWRLLKMKLVFFLNLILRLFVFLLYTCVPKVCLYLHVVIINILYHIKESNDSV